MRSDGVQYLLPAGLGAKGASEALGRRLQVRRDPAATVERAFYDTFDARLHGAGLVVVHSEGRLALTDAATYEQHAATDWSEAPERVLAGELPAGRLRDELLPIVDVRALLTIARVRSRVRRLRVLDDHAKTVVRLTVVESTARRGRSRTALPARVILSPVRGYGGELARVRRALEQDLDLAVADAPLHDEAVAAAGGSPGWARTKPELALAPDQRADGAAAAVLARLLEVVEANVPGAVADVDSEFLHDLRVAVRRSRSVQRQLAGVFPPEPLAHFRAELRWLQQVTGPARDLDVYLLDFDGLRSALPGARAGDVEPLRGVLAEARRAAHRRAARALRSARASTLIEDWKAFLDGLVELSLHDRPAAGRQIGELAGERIRAVYRRMVKMGRAIDDSSPPEALHELRKTGKELRYLLELFGDLYPREAVKPLIATLKSLQDTLGRFQDREVQADTLRSLGEKVVAREDGAAALMAMGVLVERLERDQASARSQFAARFAALAAKPTRALVERAFR